MKGPLSLLSETITLNRPVVVFLRNNKKLFGYLRAFDRHMNLALENVRELSSNHEVTNKIKYYERFICKMVLRGDSIIIFVPV